MLYARHSRTGYLALCTGNLHHIKRPVQVVSGAKHALNTMERWLFKLEEGCTYPLY